jgi:DNA-binding NtrC family response regulator
MTRVLLLVAEQNVRRLRRLVLEAACFRVEAPELDHASQLLESGPFDALVLGSMDGAEAQQLIATFRSRNPQGRVVAVGAQARSRLPVDAMVDPFEPSTLIEALQDLPGKNEG